MGEAAALGGATTGSARARMPFGERNRLAEPFFSEGGADRRGGLLVEATRMPVDEAHGEK